MLLFEKSVQFVLLPRVSQNDIVSYPSAFPPSFPDVLIGLGPEPEADESKGEERIEGKGGKEVDKDGPCAVENGREREK